MKVNVNIVFTTYNPQESKIDVLLYKHQLPSQTITKLTLGETIEALAAKYLEADPIYFSFDLIDAIHDKECGRLRLYYYAFLPPPAPIKKGGWYTAWEIYREDNNEEVFGIIQEAARKATQRLQSGIR